MRTALRLRPIQASVKQEPPKVDPFLANLNEALAQVDPRVCVEIRWLANLGLVVEAERLLIDYLVSDNRSYEVLAEREAQAKAHRMDSLAFSLWMCRIVDCNVLGTFAACMGWVFLG